MTQKIAINKDYGGFNISDEAFEMLLTLKGVVFTKTESTLLGEKCYDFYNNSDDNDTSDYLFKYDYIQNRADKDLIKVIETLGTRANDRYSTIKIVEIPDNVDWHISEYDGLEHVAENHRTWY
jgi:hypothetical protein